MSKSKSIPVRLSEETIALLDEADQKLKLGNRSLLIKLCLEAFLRAFKERQVLELPLEWKDIAWSLDGRRKLAIVAENDGEEPKAPSLGKVTYGKPRRMKKG